MVNVVYPSAPNGFSFLRTNGPISPPLEWGIVASGSAVTAGDLLSLSSGALIPATTGAIVGVAQADGAAGVEIPYIPATADVLYEAEYNVTSADMTGLAGVAKDISGTTGAQCVVAATNNPQVRIIGWSRETNPGAGNIASYGRVVVSIYKGAYSTQVV